MPLVIQITGGCLCVTSTIDSILHERLCAILIALIKNFYAAAQILQQYVSMKELWTLFMAHQCADLDLIHTRMSLSRGLSATLALFH